MGLFKSRDKKSDTAQSATSVTLSDGQTYNIANAVDCLGDSCPRPQLMTKKAMKEANSGEVVEVSVDNPTSMEALPPMCDGLGASHLETVSGDRGWQVYIQKN
ncbi:MAG: sulfurtransferase TusA family protein [Granulosicoccus sp.]|nr:sulfurtransferase TusA family protein [Granulosicoccus sp.]